MSESNYNTYTISDSDDSVITENHESISQKEPEFFQQILQQQKRKKFNELIACHDKDFGEEDVQTIGNQNVFLIEEDYELSVCNYKNQKNVEFCNSDIPETSFYGTINNNPTTEVIEPKRKKRRTKEEIIAKKLEEKAIKDAKQKLTDELKRLNPNECMKYMTVHVDVNILSHDYGELILSELQSTDAKYKMEINSVVPHSITWSRQISSTVVEEEHFMLLIWDYDYAKNLIMCNQLSEKIIELKLLKAQLSIIIYSTMDQLKKIKSKKNGQFSKSDMINSLDQMMLSYHVSFRFIEDKNDIGLAIVHYTKSIAQKPYKLNKYKEEQYGCDWYASGHTKNCVTVDKNGTGLSQLWRQMLAQFPLCALETSEAIASVYGSPVTLLRAYDKCSSRLEGETLLQDIPVRRGFGPLASNRRIGPELSKKIYTFFTDNTGCTTLTQE